MNCFEALEKAGLRWPRSGKLSCPLHNDKTPSLQLYQDNYFCFSCNATGDGYGLLAILTGQPVEDVLRQYAPKGGQRVSKETLDLVGPQAMEQSMLRRYRDMNRDVFERLHEVFGDFQDQVLLDEIERMNDQIMELRRWLTGDDQRDAILAGEAEEPVVPPPIKEGVDAIDRFRDEAMQYMAEREEKLLHPNRVAVRDREAEDDGGAR